MSFRFEATEEGAKTVPPTLGMMGGQGVAGVRDATPCFSE